MSSAAAFSLLHPHHPFFLVFLFQPHLSWFPCNLHLELFLPPIPRATVTASRQGSAPAVRAPAPPRVWQAGSFVWALPASSRSPGEDTEAPGGGGWEGSCCNSGFSVGVGTELLKDVLLFFIVSCVLNFQRTYPDLFSPYLLGPRLGEGERTRDALSRRPGEGSVKGPEAGF